MPGVPHQHPRQLQQRLGGRVADGRHEARLMMVDMGQRGVLRVLLDEPFPYRPETVNTFIRGPSLCRRLDSRVSRFKITAESPDSLNSLSPIPHIRDTILSVPGVRCALRARRKAANPLNLIRLVPAKEGAVAISQTS